MFEQTRGKERSGAELHQQLASYLPKLQIRRLAGRGGLPAAAEREALAGALLFADISGFSALTERLAPRGPRGAEQLSELLNDAYGRVIDQVEAHGGDILVFVGDAAIVLWRAQDAAGLPDAVLPAARCAEAIQRAISTFESGEGIRVQMRASLGAGPLQVHDLGGVGDRWLHVVAGEALEQAVATDAQARPGDVLLSKEAAAALGELASTEALDGGARRLRSLAAPAAAPAAKEPSAASALPVAVLEACVPEVIAARLAAGQSEFLAEFRRTSVLFLGLPTSERTLSVDALQQALTAIQCELLRFGGTLYQCLRDDKGLVVVAAFGMPPRSHEDDAARAALAALAIRTRLQQLGQPTGIGIATGRLFCGTYGTEARRQYALVGSTINLAARLLQQARGDAIVCDEATERDARRRVTFARERSVSVKGWSGPVRVCEPTGRRETTELYGATSMIGRRRELAALVGRVDALAAGGRAGIALVEAEAGMGKSTLLAALAASAQAAGVGVVRGVSDAIESNTPYYPFRAVYQRLLELEGGAPPAAVAAAVERRLGAAPELVPLLSLVRAVVPVDLPESDLTRQMAGPVRADNTNRLLLHLLGDAARSQPLLLLLEDGHWMDSASWHLTLQIARSQPRVLVVLSTRPLEKPPTEHGKLLELPEATRIELASLASEELMALVARRLGVDALPDALSRLLEERSEGNPFYAEELALSLRDAGLVVVEDGRCRLVSETALSELNVPATLQGVITGRVDRLPPTSQLTLKVASVIGRLFETPMLCGVHPIPADVETVPQQLEGLTAAELIAPEPTPQVPAHGFRHAVIHESVYGLLPYAQRRTLHRAVALHLEEVHRHDRATIHPLLAHHYDAAEMPNEAVASLRAAGEQALDASANQEAVRLLARALALDAGRQNGLSSIERIELQRSLGMAHFGLTQYDGQRAAYESVLRGAGIRIPRGDWRILQELGVLLRQALRERLTGRRAPRLAGDAHEACVLAMRAQGDMLTALSFEGRRFEAVEVALQMFNLGGRIDPTPEASAARVGYGLFLAMTGLRGIGERQIQRGLDECLAAGQLLYTVQAFTILGQVLVMRGRCREGCRCLREAVARADALGTKLWHQRSSYALGDALSATGEFEESRASLVRAGALSLDTEPQTVGLMRSLQGLCMLRLGRDDEALALLEEGVAASRDHPAALPIFASLGALAEARLRCGSLEPALDAAREAEEISRRSNEVSAYRPGIHGFWGICQVYLALWRRAESGEAGVTPQAAGEARLRAERAVRAFRGFVRVFPSARPRWQLAEGLRQLQRGRTRRALRWFRRAARGAGSSEQPYEQGLAYFYLAQHGSRRERPWAAERAREVLERAHLAHELRELRAFGGSVAVT